MRYKILYVDDEKSNLRIFKDTFRRDFEIITAESGQKALDFLAENTVDVVITDQKMPNMTGVELLREINLRYNDIPPNRLILSGYAENDEIKIAFKKYKLSNFISKPWNYQELKQTITNCINN